MPRLRTSIILSEGSRFGDERVSLRFTKRADDPFKWDLAIWRKPSGRPGRWVRLPLSDDAQHDGRDVIWQLTATVQRYVNPFGEDRGD